jgi:hypothetical protein
MHVARLLKGIATERFHALEGRFIFHNNTKDYVLNWRYWSWQIRKDRCPWLAKS